MGASRPFQRACRDIQPPVAHPGDPLRFQQLALALAERLFRPLALRDIHQHVDGADKPPLGVVQGGWIRNEGDAGAVGPFRHGFATAHRAVFLQRNGHRALMMG
jgi:hypothetical protein